MRASPAYQAEALVGAMRSAASWRRRRNRVRSSSSTTVRPMAPVRWSTASAPRVKLDACCSTRARGRHATRVVDASTRSLVALLDADDIWEPTKLERQVAELDDPAVDVVFCWAQNTTVRRSVGQPDAGAAAERAARAPRGVRPGRPLRRVAHGRRLGRLVPAHGRGRRRDASRRRRSGATPSARQQSGHPCGAARSRPTPGSSRHRSIVAEQQLTPE